MKLTENQKLLVEEAFSYLEEPPTEDENLIIYGSRECSIRTVKALLQKGFIEEFDRFPKGFIIQWNAQKVYQWGNK